MLIKVAGVALMLDGVLSAMAALPKIDTFIYRSLLDQSLAVAHIVNGALLLLVGRLIFNERPSRLAVAPVIAAFAIAAIETTRFDWLWLVGRGVYTLVVFAVLVRTTLPKT